MGELKGKTALVTGGTRGIGRATALALADMGADVAINFFRSRESAKAAVDEIEKKGVKAIAVRANMGNEEQIPKMFEEVKGAFGKLDILVSNAALGHFGNVLEVNDKMWDVAMSTNAKALLFSAQEAVKMMPDGGKIVALTSLGSHRYIPGYATSGAFPRNRTTLPSKSSPPTIPRFTIEAMITVRTTATSPPNSGGLVKRYARTEISFTSASAMPHERAAARPSQSAAMT